MGSVLFIDASLSGIAGDMLVAALIDLGVPLDVIRDALGGFELDYSIEMSSVSRSGIVAQRFIVHSEDRTERHWSDIREMIERASTLSAGARTLALSAFERLAHAEADVHGCSVDHVHFHEVGAADSIVDIVAACVALDRLGARVIVSPLPMGRGTVVARHGVLPLPAPATVSCLHGAPTFDGGIDAELVTPTGATLVATVASAWERWPAIRPEKTGWGAGTRELPDRPNVVRVVLGEDASESRQLVVLEANVDDMTPEIGAHVIEAALDAGALDAWLTPITMKKGRLGVLVSALSEPSTEGEVSRVLLSESSTIGIRKSSVTRVARPRKIISVETRFGPIDVKIAEGDGLPRNVAPEIDSCRAAAKEHGVPLKVVLAAALAAVEPV